MTAAKFARYWDGVRSCPPSKRTSTRGELQPWGTGPIISKEFALKLETWEFDAFEHKGAERNKIVPHLLANYTGALKLFVQTNMEPATVNTFISVVESKYVEHPFHNFSHALDCAFTVCHFMKRARTEYYFSDTAQLGLVVAAIGHDLAHPGVTNPFLVETRHDLAMTYNDRSPLENMHSATLFEILRQKECNIFRFIERNVYVQIRTGIIETILHTDLTLHEKVVKDLSQLFATNSDAFERDSNDGVSKEATEVLGSKANAELLANAMLHFADIANPLKNWVVCQRLAHMVMSEFFNQGDKERALGIPVQMLNDRHKVNIPQSQIGFVEFLLLPLVEVMLCLLPPLSFLAEHLEENTEAWYEVWTDQTTPAADLAEKTRARVDKVVSSCKALTHTDSFREVSLNLSKQISDDLRHSLSGSADSTVKKRGSTGSLAGPKSVRMRAFAKTGEIVTSLSGHLGRKFHPP